MVGVVTKLLVEEVQQRSFDKSTKLNPVSNNEVERLVIELVRRMPVPVPDWLLDSHQVLAIGGPNSIFQLALTVLRSDELQAYPRYDIECVTPDDVRVALQFCTGKEDSELQKFVDFPFADSASLIVPKLALLYSVMQHINLTAYRPVFCSGSCAGLITLDRFWL